MSELQLAPAAAVGAMIAGLRRARHLPELFRRVSLLREPLAFTWNEIDHEQRLGRYTLRRSGLHFFLRHHTADGTAFNEIFLSDLYEPPAVVARMLGALGRPPRVLDLGGHIGMFGLQCLDRYGDAEITALEPDPANAELHRRTVIENCREASWKLLEACATNTSGVVSFCTVQGSGTDSHVVRDDRPLADKNGVIQCPTVDSFEYMTDVDLVKVDIEGSEWSILTDPRFAKRRVPALVLEYHPAAAPEEDARGAAERLLAGAGYRVSFIAEQGRGMGMLWAWDPKIESPPFRAASSSSDA